MEDGPVEAGEGAQRVQLRGRFRFHCVVQPGLVVSPNGMQVNAGGMRVLLR